MSFAIIDFNRSKCAWKTKVEYYSDRIEVFLPTFRIKKSNKYSKKIIKILNENRIRKVVLNKNLLCNRIFFENLVNAKKQVITGKNIYKTIILRVLNDLSNQMDCELYKLKIALLINDFCIENIDLIKTIAKEVKSLILVTNDKSKFENLGKELFKKEGIVLKITEKKDSYLEDTNIIVNVDFQNYEINGITINNNSLIICGLVNEFEAKKGFNGIAIKRIEVLDPENTNSNIDDLSLCEAKIYSYLRKIKQNDRAFDRMGFKLNGYYGENGKLTSKDFNRFGQKIVKKSS